MRRGPLKFFIVVVAIVIVTWAFFIQPAKGSEFFLNEPHLNEGKLFVLELRPADRAIEVRVAGKEAVNIQWQELDIEVEGQYGKKREVIPIVKTNNLFILKPKNPDPSALHFKMHMGQKSEDITVVKP